MALDRRGRGVPTCAYRVDAALVEDLDRHLGPPWTPTCGVGRSRAEVDPRALAAAAARALGGRSPDVAGHVDHARLGDLYKSGHGGFSVGQALLDTLDAVDG